MNRCLRGVVSRTDMKTEWEWVEWLRAHAGPPPRSVRATWHDDATCWSVGSESYVLSVDQFIEGYHFKRSWLSPRAIGMKAILRAVSDVLVKGARPWMLWTAVALPRTVDDSFMTPLYEGIFAGCRSVGARLVGGDTAAAPVITLSVTVLGRSERRPILRRGLRAGDVLWLTGPVGWAAAGLELLRRYRNPIYLDPQRLHEQARAVTTELNLDASHEAAVRRALRAFVRPTLPRRHQAWLRAVGRAAIDISDGLIRDLERLARVNGVVLRVSSSALRIGRAFVRLCGVLGLDPVATAAGGGEDYAWIVGTRSRVRPPGGRWPVVIGRVVEKGEPAVYLDDRRVSMGWDRFNSRE